MNFKVGDEVMVVLVRGGLGASLGDHGTVVRSDPRPLGSTDDFCGVRVRWRKTGGLSGLCYNNQFATAEGPW